MSYSNKIRSGQNRLLSTHGVRDLREVLDKKRSEKESGQSQSTPPPSDPSFNYLKDPAREAGDKRPPQFHNKQYHKTRNFAQNWQNRPKFQQRQRPHQQQNQDIENPCNIKVEFSTTSGEHTYTLDENVKLPTIKHVPDRKLPPIRRNNYEHQRGGRRRYVQSRQYRGNKPRNTDKDDGANGSVDATQETSDSAIVQQLENIDLNQDEDGVEDEEDGGEIVDDEDEIVDGEQEGEHREIVANIEKVVDDGKENRDAVEKENSK